jgi:hypothetical protein
VPQGFGELDTDSGSFLLVAVAGTVYRVTESSLTALTGLTFNASATMYFLPAFGRCYITDGITMAYTENGSTLVTYANSLPGLYPTLYSNRLYIVDPVDRSKIWFSNEARITYPSGSGALTLDLSRFGTFDTDMSLTPKKNAGFLILPPGEGVVITSMASSQSDNSQDGIYAHTSKGKVWKIVQSGVDSSTGVLNHGATIISTDASTQAHRSVGLVGNDLWFYDQNRNITSLAEVATYQNKRPTIKSGSLQPYFKNIPTNGDANVAIGVFESDIYISMQRGGAFNDTLFVYNSILRCWSTPITGLSLGAFMRVNQSGEARFVAYSVDPADKYLYRLSSTYTERGTPVSMTVYTKETECSLTLIKRGAIYEIEVAKGSGVMTVTPILDGVEQTPGIINLSTIASRASGSGTFVSGTIVSGTLPDPGTTSTGVRDRLYSLNGEYEPFRRVGFKITHSGSESFIQVTSIRIKYKAGKSDYESVTFN